MVIFIYKKTLNLNNLEYKSVAYKIHSVWSLLYCKFSLFYDTRGYVTDARPLPRLLRKTHPRCPKKWELRINFHKSLKELPLSARYVTPRRETMRHLQDETW